MEQRQVSVVVTDLDNTLFDWVEMWYRSFSAMLRAVAEKSGVSEEQLKPEFRRVHQRHGTAEYAFSLRELPSLLTQHSADEIPHAFRDAIQAYRDERERTLRLYPQVLDTLVALRGKGCLVVGYTESMAFYSNYRIRKLGLDGILDYLFSPADHDIPEDLARDELRRYAPVTYEFRHTVHRHTPKGELKPNPHLLLTIIEAVGASPSECLYIGDNLYKDVRMAKEAGVLAVHANYGQAHEREEYELLKEVTHWTDKDVERESRAKDAEVQADVILADSFGEVAEIAEFVRFEGGIAREEPDLPASVVAAWEKTVDVQQHFNDLELRVRNFAVTIATAVLGAAAVAFNQVPTIVPWILIAGIVGWGLLYMMDRHWYHRLLLGSVFHGLAIENAYRHRAAHLGLATRIGEESPVRLPTGHVLHSSQRLNLFYGVGAALFIGLCVVSLMTVNDAERGMEQAPPAGAEMRAAGEGAK